MVEVGDHILAWATNNEIREHGSSGGAVTALLGLGLESGEFDYALGIRRLPDHSGELVVTKDPDVIASLAGAVHTAPINFYKTVKKLDGRVILPAKHCDSRALHLNALRRQIDRDKLFLIGLNCGGTIDPTACPEMFQKYYGVKPEDVVCEEILEGKLILETKTHITKAVKIDDLEAEGYGRRENCRHCLFNIPTSTDLACGNWGVPKELIGKATYIEIQTDRGKKLIEKAIKEGVIEIHPVEDKWKERRAKIDQFMVRLANKWLGKELEKYETLEGFERMNAILDEFRKCDGCGKCRDVCPACICEEAKCLEFSGIDGKGGGNILLFHFIRILHMIDLCIACGQCDLACPYGIPVSRVIRFVVFKKQELEQFIPGVSLQKQPLLRTQ
ncbi:MAG: Coenzyme F420 hydrogenase/dehydrogenase, beta subunit C-terminal domain [Candidatus Heimdallarchaeota archaeon]